PASAYVPLNERCCKMLRRLIRELFPAITTVTIGRCEEWVSLSSSTARSSASRSPLASTRQQGLTHDPEHLSADLLALFLAGSGGEQGQKGIEGVSGHRETELARGQLQQ